MSSDGADKTAWGQKLWQRMLGVWVLAGVAALALLASDPRQRRVLAGSAAIAAAVWMLAVFRSGLHWDLELTQSRVVQVVTTALTMVAAFLLVDLIQPGAPTWVSFLQFVIAIFGFNAARIIVTVAVHRLRSRRT